jgi:hypothetical protein
VEWGGLGDDETTRIWQSGCPACDLASLGVNSKIAGIRDIAASFAPIEDADWQGLRNDGPEA